MSVRNYLMVMILAGMGSGCCCSDTAAQNMYYVSENGDDEAPGTSEASAWQTLEKVNAGMSSFHKGDKILFKRGDTFKGRLAVTQSGVSIGAYGQGEKPVISGGEEITAAWTLRDGSVWETVIDPDKPAEINRLFKEDQLLPVSRHPNKEVNNGYFNFESSSFVTQITDPHLPETPDWTGSEMVVRSTRYRLVKVDVTAHRGSTLSWKRTPGIFRLTNGYGYFFRNDLKAIDQEGEWAYAPAEGKVYLYASSDPGSKKIAYSKVDTVLSVQHASHVVIEDIQVTAGNVAAISLDRADHFIIRNSTLTNSGTGITLTDSKKAVIENCRITHMYRDGITAGRDCTGAAILNNILTGIGDEAYGKAKTFFGIYCVAGESQISGNRLNHTGSAGIVTAGQNNRISRNLVRNFAKFGEDMGGIYTNFNLGDNTGTIIEENIVLEGYGEQKGAPSAYGRVYGIYLDNFSTGVTVRKNTVAHVNGTCYYLNFIRTGIKVHHNTGFDGAEHAFKTHAPKEAPYTDVHDNVFIAGTQDSTHKVLESIARKYRPEEIGRFRNNYIAGPDQSEQDSVKFYYNDTETAQHIELPAGLFIDAKNEAYRGTMVLDPFSSIVLFKVSKENSIPYHNK